MPAPGRRECPVCVKTREGAHSALTGYRPAVRGPRVSCNMADCDTQSQQRISYDILSYSREEREQQSTLLSFMNLC